MRPIYSVVAAAATFLGAAVNNNNLNQAIAQVKPADKKAETGKTFVHAIPLTLEETIDSSERIFYGVCTEIKELDSKKFSKEIEYTFKIEKGIKGVMGGETKYVSYGLFPVLHEKDKKYVLFLPKASKSGLCSPVAFNYGSLEVYRQSNEKEEFVFYIGKENNGKGKEFKLEDFIKTVNDTLEKKNKK